MQSVSPPWNDVVVLVAAVKVVAKARSEAKAIRDSHNRASTRPLLAKTLANRTPATVEATASKCVASEDPSADLSNSADHLSDSKEALARVAETRAIMVIKTTGTTVAVRTRTTEITIDQLLTHSHSHSILSILRLTRVKTQNSISSWTPTTLVQKLTPILVQKLDPLSHQL